MFCQVLDSIPWRHTELPIMVIYVPGEFISPILLGHLFPREADTYNIGSHEVLHGHFCTAGVTELREADQVQGCSA